MATTHSAIVVLYDPATGDIIHGHYCEADSSADLPDKTTLEQSAMEYARRHAKRGVDPSKGQFLHVDPQSFRMAQKHRVDLTLKKLVGA